MKYLSHFKSIRRLQVMLLALATVLGSCKKLIEIPPNPSDKISRERAYSDSLNVLATLVGIYGGFGTGGFGGSINTAATSINTGLASDELTPNPLYAELEQFSTNNILPGNGTVSNLWRTGYAGIYQCNAFFEGIAASTGITNSFREQVKAEVLLARALYYFNLVNQFGDVPIVTGTSYKDNAVQPRKPVDSVYALILRDLTAAVGVLQVKYPSAGRARPNLNTARAFLAKVYLYRGQWQQAANLSDLVIRSGDYDLIEPSKVFNTNSREAIWQLPTLSTFTGTSDASDLIPYANDVVPNYYFSDYLASAFEEGDLRKTAWAGLNVAETNGAPTEYYYPAKYKNTNNSASTVEDYMMFRVAEQYLIRAEAVAKQDLLDSARSSINKVRARAGLPATTAVSKDDVLAAIEKERFTELFCEAGNRWYDLKRTGRITSVLEVRKPGFVATDALFPIPLNEIQLDVKLEQNPGYK